MSCIKTEDNENLTVAKGEKVNTEYKLYITSIAKTRFICGRFSVLVSSYKDRFIDLKV